MKLKHLIPAPLSLLPPFPHHSFLLAQPHYLNVSALVVRGLERDLQADMVKCSTEPKFCLIGKMVLSSVSEKRSTWRKKDALSAPSVIVFQAFGQWL